MLDSTKDNPGVIAFPPLILLVSGVLSVLVHLLVRWRITPSHLAPSLGTVVIVLAVTLAGSALRVMRAAGTSIDPAKPSLTVVRSGPYRFTRNPMYLALCLLQVALGLIVNDWITLLFVIPLAIVLHYGVILREERYLGRKFGEPYLALKRDVRRWL